MTLFSSWNVGQLKVPWSYPKLEDNKTHNIYAAINSLVAMWKKKGNKRISSIKHLVMIIYSY